MTIICSQAGCPRTYHKLHSFSKHLHRADSTPSSTNAVSVQPIYQGGALNNFVETDDLISDVLEMDTDAVASESRKRSDLGDCAASFVAEMYASSNVTFNRCDKEC